MDKQQSTNELERLFAQQVTHSSNIDTTELQRKIIHDASLLEQQVESVNERNHSATSKIGLKKAKRRSSVFDMADLVWGWLPKPLAMMAFAGLIIGLWVWQPIVVDRAPEETLNSALISGANKNLSVQQSTSAVAEVDVDFIELSATAVFDGERNDATQDYLDWQELVLLDEELAFAQL